LRRIVLDTNTVVSGLFWHGAPRQLFDAARRGAVSLSMSPPPLDELMDVRPRTKFAPKIRSSGQTVQQLVNDYARLAIVVHPTVVERVISADPDDDAVLACASAAKSELIVSGDHHLLSLGSYHGIPIVTAAEALQHLAVP
jgi:putative PIN family toxin of toxin-antitoxin system